MMSVIQPLLEKGIVDHSIIHKALMEFFTIADKVIFVMFTYCIYMLYSFMLFKT